MHSSSMLLSPLNTHSFVNTRSRIFERRIQASLSLWDTTSTVGSAEKLQMAAGKVAHATLKGPSVVKEICIGLALGLVAGGFWKMHHWNEQRKVRAFYDMLEKGQISVVVEE